LVAAATEVPGLQLDLERPTDGDPESDNSDVQSSVEL
jgi:hypothetical protein